MPDKIENEKEIVNSWFNVFLGNLHVILLSSICFYLLYEDYKFNNYSFFAKNRFHSNSNPNDYFERDASSNFLCSRYFSDYIISEKEAKVMLKLSQIGFEKSNENDIVFPSDPKYESIFMSDEFKTVYKLV